MAEYESSGMSRAAFCQQTGLSLSTLARCQRRKKQKTSEATEAKRWLAVKVSGGDAVASGETASGLAVSLAGGRRIEISRGFDAATLQRLLAAVERG